MIYELLAVGAESARTSRELAELLGVDRRSITQQIEKERRQGKPICASCTDHKGYYLAATDKDIENYCGRLLHRAGELHKTRRAMLSRIKPAM